MGRTLVGQPCSREELPVGESSEGLMGTVNCGSFPKIWGAFLGVPRTKDCSSWGTIWGSLYFGKVHCLVNWLIRVPQGLFSCPYRHILLLSAMWRVR